MIKKYLAIILLLIYTVFLYESVFLQGKIPIPADTIVGLYHPWRDFYAEDFPLGIPFKNFLITDPVRQQYVWRQLAIENIKMGNIPLWNPYEAAGSPLLGNFQSAVLYPLNILYVTTSNFTAVWTLQIILQTILAGVFMYIYLNHLKLGTHAKSLGVLAWTGSGYFVAWLEWNTFGHVVLWLPLILLAIDKIVDSQKAKTALTFSFLLGIFLAASLLAGFWQVFGYTTLFSCIYFLFRVSRQKNLRAFLFFAIGLVTFLLLSFVQLHATFDWLSSSVRAIEVVDYDKPGRFLPWQNLAQFIAPDYFGNPATLNYFGVWNYLEFIGYVGLIPLVFALFALIGLNRKNLTAVFFAASLLVSLILILPNLISYIPYQIKIPLFSLSQPTRIMSVICFCLATLSAFGMEKFVSETKPHRQMGAVLVFIGSTLSFLGLIAFTTGSVVSQRNLALPTVLALVTIFLILLYRMNTRLKTLVLSSLLVLTLLDLARFAKKYEAFADEKYLFPKTTTTEFLQAESKKSSQPFRIASINDEILPPNFSVYYRLEDIAEYNSLLIERYAKFIKATQEQNPKIPKFLGFNRILLPKDFDSKSFDLLGVKYVLSIEELRSPKYEVVLVEGNTRVFRNKNALPRAFFVNNLIVAKNEADALKLTFQPGINFANTAVIEDSNPSTNLGVGEVKIIKYSENEIILETENQNNGFLVLTDVYYPKWHATIDGVESKIIPTNYTFRGVFVPPGHHTIRFCITLL